MASPVVSPLDALVVPHVISSDVPVMPPANVPITYPHVVNPIGGSETTSSTIMEDSFVAHMSHFIRGSILSFCERRGVFSL